MRARYALMTAAAIAIGGYAMGPQVWAQDDPNRGPGERTGQAIDNAAQRTEDAIRRGGEGTVAAPDAEGIRDVIAQATEASVTKSGLDDLVERFVDADRNRLGEGNLDDVDHLNGIIDQFQRNWQARYNAEFDISDEGAVFNETFATIIQGEIGEGARLAGERQPGERPGTDPGAQPGVQPDTTPGPESDRVTGGDVNREPGREVARVTVQESHGLPTIALPMVKEMPDSWRIDVPDHVNADQLRKNLEDTLTKLNQSQAQWPADQQEAQRVVAHHILLAVMDHKPGMQEGGMDRPMPGQERPGMGQDTPAPDRPNQPVTPGEPAQPR